MNKPLSLLLRFAGFSRPAPKTRFGRTLRRSERTLTVLLVIYASLHAFPQVLFALSVTAEGITIYSRTPLPPGAVECAKRTAALVQQSELAVPGRREHIFVCDSPWLFQLFKPTAGGFAYSVPRRQAAWTSTCSARLTWLAADVARASREAIPWRWPGSVRFPGKTSPSFRETLI